MDLMGIEAVYPKPKLSQPGEGHRLAAAQAALEEEAAKTAKKK